MAEYDPLVLPSEGVVTLDELAKFLKTTDETLIESLRKNKIPVLKLGKFRRMWVIRLEDLKGKPLMSTVDEGDE